MSAFMCVTYRVPTVLQLILSLASDVCVIKQESDFHSDLSCNLHKNYMTRAELRNKREEVATAPVLDCGLIPELLDYVVDDKSVPKVPLLSDEQR